MSCLLCGEEEGATVGKFSWCPWLAALSSSPLPLWHLPRTSWVPACLRLLTRHFFRAERLVIGARRRPHPRPHPHDAAWESELDGSQLIVPATLYPFPYAQPLLCFPGVRTEQGPGWVRLNIGSQPEKWKVCFIHASFTFLTPSTYSVLL